MTIEEQNRLMAPYATGNFAANPLGDTSLRPDSGQDFAMSPDTIDALRQSRAGRPAFIMRGSNVLAAPPTSPQSIPGAAVLGTPQGDWAAMNPRNRDQQYQDQLDSAERLRRMQELDRFMAAGMVAPKDARPVAAQQPKYVNVSGALYKIDPMTGQSEMVVERPAAKEQTVPIGYITEEQKSKNPPGEGQQDILKGQFNGQNLYQRSEKRAEPTNMFKQMNDAFPDIPDLPGAGGAPSGTNAPKAKSFVYDQKTGTLVPK